MASLYSLSLRARLQQVQDNQLQQAPTPAVELPLQRPESITSSLGASNSPSPALSNRALSPVLGLGGLSDHLAPPRALESTNCAGQKLKASELDLFAKSLPAFKRLKAEKQAVVEKFIKMRLEEQIVMIFTHSLAAQQDVALSISSHWSMSDKLKERISRTVTIALLSPFAQGYVTKAFKQILVIFIRRKGISWDLPPFVLDDPVLFGDVDKYAQERLSDIRSNIKKLIVNKKVTNIVQLTDTLTRLHMGSSPLTKNSSYVNPFCILVPGTAFWDTVDKKLAELREMALSEQNLLLTSFLAEDVDCVTYQPQPNNDEYPPEAPELPVWQSDIDTYLAANFHGLVLKLETPTESMD